MKLRRIYLILLPLLMLTMAAGLCFGSAPLSLSELAAAFSGPGTARTILLGIRLPRVLAGLLALGIGRIAFSPAQGLGAIGAVFSGEADMSALLPRTLWRLLGRYHISTFLFRADAMRL